jgi:hypothetical protein
MGSPTTFVKYTRLFQQGPLTPAQKQELKDAINAIIDEASSTITIEAMVVPPNLKPDEKT